MVTQQNLDNLKDKLSEISTLALQYKLDDITLAKHVYFDNTEKFYFVLSKEKEILSLEECAEIHIALCRLLEIDWNKQQESIQVEIKELFNPGYFEDTYIAEFSLAKNPPRREALNSFIKDTLGFKEKESENLYSSSPDHEKEKDSDKGDKLLSTNPFLNDLKIKSSEEPRALANVVETENSVSKTMRGRDSSAPLTHSSTTLFKTKKRHANEIDENSTLPPHLQFLLEELEQAFCKHPEYQAKVVKRFSEIEQKASKFVIEQLK